MSEVRGEGLGREFREEVSGVSSYCFSCFISFFFVRLFVGGKEVGLGGKIRVIS